MDLSVDTVSDAAGTGPASLVKQWLAQAHYSYTQITPTLEQDGNLSSVTDDATGLFTCNFTSNFSDAVYAGVHQSGAFQSSNTAVANRNLSNVYGVNTDPPIDVKSTSAYKVINKDSGTTTLLDTEGAGGMMVGDLA